MIIYEIPKIDGKKIATAVEQIKCYGYTIMPTIYSEWLCILSRVVKKKVEKIKFRGVSK